MTTCKSCRAEVVWTVTDKGEPMPIDPDSVPTGNLVVDFVRPGQPVDRRTGKPLLTNRSHMAGLEDDSAEPRYVSHFVSCPAAASHRKRR